MRRLGKRIFWGIILNSVAILLCQKILNYLWQDFYFQGSVLQLLIFALVLTILNLLLKPILHFIFLPLIWITLGIFNIVLNLAILKVATLISPLLEINSPLAWITASIVISIFNAPLHRIR